MKLKQYDIFLLLGSLFFFSCGIGIWREGKKNEHQPLSAMVDINNMMENSLEVFTDKDVINYLKPLSLSRSVEKIIEVMKGLSAKRAQEIATLLLSNTSLGLRRLDKKELILGLSLLYANENGYDAFFNLYDQSVELHQGEPLLALAVDGMYSKAVPLLLSWLQRNKDTLSDSSKNMIKNSYSFAIAQNETTTIARLVQAGVPLSAELATDLLWQLAQKRESDSGVVPLFVSSGASINEARDKKTPLIQAVINKNKALVQALIKAGATVDTIVDNNVGSALQNALLTKNIEIEEILRDAGARE